MMWIEIVEEVDHTEYEPSFVNFAENDLSFQFWRKKKQYHNSNFKI